MIKICCLNTTLLKIAEKLLICIIYSCFLTFFLFSCTSNKNDETGIEKKPIEINAEKRARAAADKNPLFSSSRISKNTTFEFSTSNVLWRASLKSLEDMPLSNVDYSGGIILTDWYNISNNSTNLSKEVKIRVQFLSDKAESSSLQVTGHLRECKNLNSCKISRTSDTLNNEIKIKILEMAREISLKNEKIKK